ncbi:hypothetical protein J3B02_003791 [Coemansia erecta]|uniref:Uncharacterized protein n=1 Tax=Coemansia asiatica TaxID=1052880 RepID=A0A9W8CKM9_9FUNG|nr:hypothetical protein LPJ64_002835 [Coemansia asiatica]KAJ2849466.1 hypothetical protein J3B02_003791 [Coemansia erecta]KAJ2886931.1 hypothetical protein FB639_001470 [Coemansia asiatica]
MQFWTLFLQEKGNSWISPAAVVIGIAAITGGSLYLTMRYLKVDQQRTERIRAARLKYKALISDLNECKGLLNFIDSESMPQAEKLVEEAKATEDKQRLSAIERELFGISDQLTRLMEKIDGVAPALVLEASQLDPWAEHEEELRLDAIKTGLGQVFDMTGDVRAIRRGLIRKAERKAQAVDGLRKAVAGIERK